MRECSLTGHFSAEHRKRTRECYSRYSRAALRNERGCQLRYLVTLEMVALTIATHSARAVNTRNKPLSVAQASPPLPRRSPTGWPHCRLINRLRCRCVAFRLVVVVCVCMIELYIAQPMCSRPFESIASRAACRSRRLRAASVHFERTPNGSCVCVSCEINEFRLITDGSG